MSYLTRVAASIEALGRSIDVACNELFWPIDGVADQTVSLHAAMDREAGGKVGCALCAALAVLVQWRHCSITLANGPMPWWVYLRAGACFGGAFYLIGRAAAAIVAAL